MITILKLAGLSAMLSAGVVTGFSGQEQKLGAEPAKVFYDRLPDGPSARVTLASVDPRALVPVSVNNAAKSDRIETGKSGHCGDSARLQASTACAPNVDAPPATTSEVRGPGNVSTLVRHGDARAVAAR